MLFEVQAKCGHVGKNMYTLKTFAVNTSSRAEAAALVRNLPRVKHHHRDAILRVAEIDRKRQEAAIRLESARGLNQLFGEQERCRTQLAALLEQQSAADEGQKQLDRARKAQQLRPAYVLMHNTEGQLQELRKCPHR